MAIDSAEKRKSAAGVPFLPVGPGVTPNATPDQEWRQQSAWSYSGILAGGGAAAVLIAQSRSAFRFTFGRVWGRVN